METKDILLKLIKRLIIFHGRLLIICITFISMMLFGYLYPIFVKNITDKGMIGKNIEIVFIYSLILAAILILEQFVNLIQMHLSVSLRNQFQQSLYYEAFSKILNLKIKYFEDKNSSEIMTKIITDIQTVSIITDNGIINIMNYLLRIISGSIGLFLIDKRLTVVVLIIIPLKFTLVLQTSKRKEKFINIYIEKFREFTSWFSDMINGIREIKLWNLHEIKKEIFISKHQEVIQTNIKSTKMDSYNSFGDNILNAMLTCLLYFIGGFMVCRSDLSVGSMLAFLSYSGYVTGPISTLFNLKYIFSGILPSAKRLFEFLDLDEEDRNIYGKKVGIFQSISFENISYNFDNKNILKNINLKINKGDKVAIIGKNGSGKTTILKLLLQIMNPLSGDIKLNSININEYNLDDYRELFSVVGQDVYLFQDSLMNNIDVQRKNTTEEILAVCRKSCLENFLEHLPNGLNSLVRNNGTNLSVGEKRKISIARAYAKSSQILILDEFNANLDIESDRSLYESLMLDYNEKTIIMITHDYNHLTKMNIIYELKEGILIRIK